MTFRDLTLTLTYTSYDNYYSQCIFISPPFQVTLIEFRAKAIDITDHRFHHTECQYLTLDMTLTRELSSILKSYVCFEEFLWRAFECRFAGLYTTIDSRDSRGGGVGSDPPGGRGYGISIGGAGLTRAPLGGSRFYPLPDFLYIPKTGADIDAKFSVPSPVSIWRLPSIFLTNSPIFFSENDVL